MANRPTNCRTSSSARFRKPCTFLAAWLILFNTIAVPLARACTEHAMIVFDASGSMRAFPDGTSKFGVARQAVAEVLPDVTRFRPTGLVTYGGGKGRTAATMC